MKSRTPKLQMLSHDSAQALILEKYPEAHDYVAWTDCLDYYAWPRVYGNTAGPFAREGMLAGQAMTTFTLEAWAGDGGYAVIFCQGVLLAVTDKFEGSSTRI